MAVRNNKLDHYNNFDKHLQEWKTLPFDPNRWFDKSFSFFITKDGRVAVNFEHAWGDGVCVLRLFNEVWKETTERPVITPDTARHSSGETSFRKLEFQLTPEHERAITAAQSKFNATVESLDVQARQVTSMSKKYIKKKKLSPDAVMQLVFQVGFVFLIKITNILRKSHVKK